MSASKRRVYEKAAGERRGELWRETTGMRHRRPRPDCPLCPLWGLPWDETEKTTHRAQHVHAEALWNAWDGSRQWPEKVVAAAAGLGVECTVGQARKHFADHRIEQPARAGRLNRQRALAEALELPGRKQEIVRHVFRQEHLTRQQIEELFFRGDYSADSGKRFAQFDLDDLIRRNFLYRWYPSDEWAAQRSNRHLRRTSFYFTGREAIPWIETVEQARIWKSSHVELSQEVGEKGALVHNTKAPELYVQLHRALRERDWTIEITPGKETVAWLNLANWYGPRNLTIRFWDPRAQRQFGMRPDGFATLSLERSGFAADDLPACQLPFFYEYDNTGKDGSEIGGQLLNYHNLARSGKAVELFPDLYIPAAAAPGDRPAYAIPVIMVFAWPEKLESAWTALRNRAQKHGYEGGVPIFLTTEKEWMADPLAPSILRHAWSDKASSPRLSLVEALLAASRELISPLCLLGPNDVLRYDPSAIPSLKLDQRPDSTKTWH